MTNNVIEQAQALYEKVGLPKEKLFTDIDEYVRFHYVYASPTTLVLAQTVGPTQGAKPTAWFIYLAVGSRTLSQVFKLAPFELPWIGWARAAKGREVVRWWPWEKVKKHLEHYDNIIFQGWNGKPTSCPKTSGPN